MIKANVIIAYFRDGDVLGIRRPMSLVSKETYVSCVKRDLCLLYLESGEKATLTETY
jgi:hypothetical protein